MYRRAVLDQDRKPKDSIPDAPAASSAAQERGAATRFTSAGAIPPVATADAGTTPTASEQAFGTAPAHEGLLHRLEDGVVSAGQHLEVLGGEAVGLAELAGLRYPVTPYHAQVDGGLYRGSRLDDAGMAALEQMGIVGVVNLCLENNDDAARAARYGLQALHVPILDNSAPTIAQMNQFIAFARANPPTYVHCEAGKGRTGTAVACYRIAVDGWTAERAIDEGRGYGLTLINQIAFIREFAATVGGADAPAANADETAEKGSAVERPGVAANDRA